MNEKDRNLLSLGNIPQLKFPNQRNYQTHSITIQIFPFELQMEVSADRKTLAHSRKIQTRIQTLFRGSELETASCLR